MKNSVTDFCGSRNDLVDIAIIGVPKAGTSSLFSALTESPFIKGTSPKETFFFMDSCSPLFRSNGHALLSDGFAGFDSYIPGDRNDALQLEGTTQNIYSETALEFFKHSKKTRFIVSLREPASRIYSLFRYVRDQQCNLDGDITFHHYTELLLSGEVGTIRHRFRSKSSYFALNNALSHSDYPYWLDRWKPLYDSGRLKIILFEELKSSPDHVIKEITGWLGLEDHTSGAKHFPESNKTNQIGNRRVHSFLQRIDNRLPTALKAELFKEIYYRIQRMAAKRRDSEAEAATDEALTSLRSYFKHANKDLSDRYRIDTDYWWPG